MTCTGVCRCHSCPDCEPDEHRASRMPDHLPTVDPLFLDAITDPAPEDIKEKEHEFMRSMKSKFRHMKEMGKEEFDNFMDEAATKYAQLKNMSEREKNNLVARTKESWKDCCDEE